MGFSRLPGPPNTPPSPGDLHPGSAQRPLPNQEYRPRAGPSGRIDPSKARDLKMSNLPFPSGWRGRGPGGGPFVGEGGQQGIDQEPVPGMKSDGGRALAWPGHSCVLICGNKEALSLLSFHSTYTGSFPKAGTQRATRTTPNLTRQNQKRPLKVKT